MSSGLLFLSEKINKIMAKKGGQGGVGLALEGQKNKVGVWDLDFIFRIFKLRIFQGVGGMNPLEIFRIFWPDIPMASACCHPAYTPMIRGG